MCDHEEAIHFKAGGYYCLSCGKELPPDLALSCQRLQSFYKAVALLGALILIDEVKKNGK